MENHGLGTHDDKMYAEISSGSTPNTPNSFLAHMPKSANYLEYFWKKSSSHVHCTWPEACVNFVMGNWATGKSYFSFLELSEKGFQYCDKSLNTD